MGSKIKLPGGSWGIVGLIAAGLLLWMVTGVLSGKKPDEPNAADTIKSAEKFHVMCASSSRKRFSAKCPSTGNTRLIRSSNSRGPGRRPGRCHRARAKARA